MQHAQTPVTRMFVYAMLDTREIVLFVKVHIEYFMKTEAVQCCMSKQHKQRVNITLYVSLSKLLKLVVFGTDFDYNNCFG